MSVTGWIADAGKEIDDLVRTGSLFEGDAAVVIAKHCPYKEEVAYVPADRCPFVFSLMLDDKPYQCDLQAGHAEPHRHKVGQGNITMEVL